MFVEQHQDRLSAGLRWGIEPILEVIGVPTSTFYAARGRGPSKRAIRDEMLIPEIRRVFDANYGVYGADKIWEHLNIVDEIRVARCTVERLMTAMGISGVRRGGYKPVTTVPAEGGFRPEDLVDRDFTASAPNQLWVADLTYVKTRTGWVYVAFIIDVFSRFVIGWQASQSLRADLAIDALEMAVFARRRQGIDLDGVIHHSDRGSQYLSIRYTERLSDNDIVSSVGSKGDSYDNAMAESFNGLYKTELIYNKGPWEGIGDVEYATLEYVDWFNHRRLHGEILDGPRYTTPAAHEHDHYRHHQPAVTQ